VVGAHPAQIRAGAPDLFSAGAVGPVCVLEAAALTHNLATMARWCRRHGVDLAPHGKTHMAPALLARQADGGATADPGRRRRKPGGDLIRTFF
jgi:D-serine deaminase-like pyridoxal phosphate-dependent protein